MLPAGKSKFQIYKSINQRLEEGFDGDILEILEEALAENNIKQVKIKVFVFHSFLKNCNYKGFK